MAPSRSLSFSFCLPPILVLLSPCHSSSRFRAFDNNCSLHNTTSFCTNTFASFAALTALSPSRAFSSCSYQLLSPAPCSFWVSLYESFFCCLFPINRSAMEIPSTSSVAVTALVKNVECCCQSAPYLGSTKHQHAIVGAERNRIVCTRILIQPHIQHLRVFNKLQHTSIRQADIALQIELCHVLFTNHVLFVSFDVRKRKATSQPRALSLPRKFDLSHVSVFEVNYLPDTFPF